MKTYEQLQKGLINPMYSIKTMTREEEEDYLYRMFYAQKPALKDKVEDAVLLETIVFNILEDKYVLRPQMSALSDPSNEKYDPAEYRKAYNTAIKVQDLIGRGLGRLGLTKRPQQYVPMAERKTFDPKAQASLREKVARLSDSVKTEEKKDA
jgi:hypothetical protein